jgi:flagellar basal-body rod protein FlgF
MENPIYISLSRMVALQRQMDVVANNVANATSTGFKRERVMFSEYLEHPTMNERLSMVQDRATTRDMSPGPMSATSNPLDVAIRGSGYFVVDTLNGPHYTRAGRFQLDPKGQIVDNNGLPVLGTDMKPIILPTGAGDIHIQGDGSVFTNLNPRTPVGKINVVTFDKEQQMIEVGSGLFLTDETPKPASKDTRVAQGVIEESNVQPVVEMTNMMNVLRQYQGIQKIVDSEHKSQESMIQKLGRQA